MALCIVSDSVGYSFLLILLSLASTTGLSARRSSAYRCGNSLSIARDAGGKPIEYGAFACILFSFFPRRECHVTIPLKRFNSCLQSPSAISVLGSRNSDMQLMLGNNAIHSINVSPKICASNSELTAPSTQVTSKLCTRRAHPRALRAR